MLAACETPRRRSDSCEYRHVQTIGREGTTICGLAASFAGQFAAKPCVIDQTVCEACSQYELPAGPELNPIVASVLFSAVELGDAPLAASAYAANHQTRQFAFRWLATCGPAPRVANVCMCTSPSARQKTEPRNGAVRIGLVGRNNAFGLGHQNRDIAAQLGVERWLVPSSSGSNDPLLVSLPCQIDIAERAMDEARFADWLDGLDLVIFVERPIFPLLPALARQRGVRVVCVPNWEWLQPALPWLDHIDLMLCPTRHTAELMTRWKKQFRFSWRIESIPWPIDSERIEFSQRTMCKRFVYVNGGGGVSGRSTQGGVMRRKGFDVLCAAARLAPELSILAYSQTGDIPDLPPNIELRAPPNDNRLLYGDGDVCVQPSHWEGLGLPLLECQAAGLPLITTDAAPMNEHQPLVTIPAELTPVHLSRELCIPAATMKPHDLAQALRAVHGSDIAAASHRARSFVEREHSWNTARPKISQALESLARSNC